MSKRVTSVIMVLALILVLKPVQAANVREFVFLITAEVKDSPAQISLRWEPIALYDGIVGDKANVITVERKLPADTAWAVLNTLPINAVTYTDSTVATGIVYQYRISSYYNKPGVSRTETVVSCGINIPAVDYRGKMILLTDNDTQASLSEKLNRLAADLTADGWQVIRRSVARSDDPHAAAEVKSVIKAVYDSDPQNVKSLFIFGHVPIPLIGWSGYDGHGSRPFPGDVYYADMDGVWTDTLTKTGSGSFANRSNLPGDGIFDQDSAPTNTELEYGRVDMYDLPLFAPLTEAQLLERYLDKDHAYRMGELHLPNRAMIQNGFNSFAETGYEILSVLCGGKASMTEENYITEMPVNEYTWQYIDGPGEYGRVGYEEHGAYGYQWREAVETEDFVYNKFKSLFSIMYGSYMGEWNSKNNILRAYLAMPEYGLTNMLSAQQIHAMALGQTFGEAIKYSASVQLNIPKNTTNNTMFFGDPGLALYPIKPVYNLQGNKTPTANILRWTPASDTDGREIIGYNVYRSDSHTGVFEKITDTPVTTAEFTDTVPDNGKNVYLVRSVAKVTSPAGTFYKIGQGSTVSIIPDIEINSVTFSSGVMPASGAVTATANISNHTAQAKSMTLIFGVYAADGGLKQIVYQTDTIDGENDEISVSLTVGDYRAGDYAKAYVWESLGDKISMTGSFKLGSQ